MPADTSIIDASLPEGLLDLDAQVVYFPVRHHSPTCARLVAQLIRQIRPAATLIEGPADFNDHIDELFLDHQLPIAIYSYVRQGDGQRRGAYYPYCLYSPEWQAMQTSRDVGAEIRFIDLPWADVAAVDGVAHRYADAELRRGRYVQHLCAKFGVEDFDDLWDKLIEVDAEIDLASYFQRVHQYCFHVRLWEEEIGESDRIREAFMAEQVRRALEEFDGRLLVVTGGFHSSALFGRLNDVSIIGADEPTAFEPPAPQPDQERGIALTPYSYDRLDSLTGYNAGMPSPGFYHRVWKDRAQGRRFSHRTLLAQVVKALRKGKQVVSTADLIAVETMAQALASVRGRTTVWRRDLLDAVTGTLVKEELEYGCDSPFLEEVYNAFRGRTRGMLAADARLPPLVQDIRRQLEQWQLAPETRPRDLEIDLLEADDLAQSRLLHRLRILGVTGFKKVDGTDFAKRDDLTRLWELWNIGWTPDYDAACIEASRYGTTLAEAATERLLERAADDEHNAAQAAKILLDAALSGVGTINDELLQRLEESIRDDGDFLTVTETLGQMLFLYCYDEALGTSGSARVGQLVHESFTRAAWLLESLGQVAGREKELLEGIRTLVETLERAEVSLDLNREELVGVLLRVEADRQQIPAVRGAAVGALWNLQETDAAGVLGDLLSFSDAKQLGDFLTGLFCLAREVAQRHPQLVQSIDELLLSFSGDQFLGALPSLRLAFTYFTPREKHHMLTTLFESLGLTDAKPLERLAVDTDTAAAALALENKVLELTRKYGLHGGDA